MVNKNFRYKGNKVKEFGINTNFFRTIANVEWYRDGTLDLPKPRNQAEISMLSKFIFGIELTCRFEVDITSYKESERIINIYNNPNEPVRKSFKRKIDRLIQEDKKYDNEELLESEV